MTRCALVLLGCLAAARVSAADTLDPSLPTPRSVLGYDIGEYHTSNLGVMRYVEALAHAVPDPSGSCPSASPWRWRAGWRPAAAARSRRRSNFRNFRRGMGKLFTNALLLAPSLK